MVRPASSDPTLAEPSSWHRWPVRLAAFVSITVIASLLCLSAAPWRELGGLVDERLRWLQRFVLATGLVAGFGAVGIYRARSGPENPASGLRRLLYPAALFTAATLIALVVSERTDPIGVAVNGFLAYVLAVWGRLSLSLCFPRSSEDNAFRVAPEIAAVESEATSNHRRSSRPETRPRR